MKPQLPRRTTSDLIARYRLEPTVRDIVVEGAFDLKIVRAILRRANCRRASIFAIDSIDISDGILDRYFLSRGEKNEIIALAKTVFDTLGHIQAFTAVVDADFDRLLEKTPEAPNILMTDYTCMEMYWYSSEMIAEFHSWLGEPLGEEPGLPSALIRIAKELFVVRAATESLKMRIPIIPFRKYCERVGHEFKFDRDKYLLSLLVNGGAAKRRGDLDAEISRLSLLIAEDERQSMHGHDLAELVFIFYKAGLAKLAIMSTPGIQAVIALMISTSALEQFPLFNEIVARCC